MKVSAISYRFLRAHTSGGHENTGSMRSNARNKARCSGPCPLHSSLISINLEATNGNEVSA